MMASVRAGFDAGVLALHASVHAMAAETSRTGVDTAGDDNRARHAALGHNRAVQARAWRVLYAVNFAMWSAVVAGLARLGVRFQDLGWDLESFCIGSRLLRSGVAVYDFEAQARAHVALAHPGFAPFPFVNPPILAIEMLSLAALPHGAALSMLWATSLAALAIAASIATRDIRSALWVTASYPAVTALGQGQLAFFALLIYTLTHRALVSGRFVRAGLIASLLVYKPQLLMVLPIAFAVSPVARRALVGLMGGLLVQLAVCLTFAREATLAYPGALIRFAAYAPRLTLAQSYTWRTFFDLLLPTHPRIAIVLGASTTLTTLAAFILAMWRRRHDLDALVAVTVIATLLGAWHCNSYDWVLAALPAWLLAPRVAISRRIIGLYVASAVVLWFDVVDWQRAHWGFAVAPAVLMGTAFGVWLVRRAV
jgi:alpha-1,2-mannosyltransferase